MIVTYKMLTTHDSNLKMPRTHDSNLNMPTTHDAFSRTADNIRKWAVTTVWKRPL